MKKKVKFTKGSYSSSKKLPKYSSTVKAVKKLKELIPPTKQCGVQYSNTIGSAGVILPMPCPIQGSTQYQREGTNIKIQRWETRLAITGAQEAGMVRVIHGRWKVTSQAGGAGVLPLVNNILQTKDYGGTDLSAGFMAGYNYTKRNNYKILSDKTYPINVFTNAAIYQHTQVLHKKFNCKGAKTQFINNSNTGDYTSLNNGMYFMLIISEPNNNLPAYVVTQTIDYTDG